MDGIDKLWLLGSNSSIVGDKDATGAGCGVPLVRPRREPALPGIYRAAVPGRGASPSCASS